MRLLPILLFSACCFAQGVSDVTFTVPNNVAVRAVLGPVVYYQLANGGACQNFDSVFELAAITAMAKNAPTANAYSTADYVAVVSKLKTWLDSHSHCAHSDTATGLRNVIDVGTQWVGSPGGSADAALISGLANLTRSRFQGLELPLDTTRLVPADQALYATITHAPAFVSEIVWGGCSIAHSDVAFAGAFNPLIVSIAGSGIDCASSYSAIKNAYTDAVPSLPQSNSDGSFTLTRSGLLNTYTSTLNSVLDLVDQTMAAKRSGKRSLNVPSANADTKDPDQPFKNAQSLVTGLSKLESLQDMGVGTEIGTVGGAIVNIAEAIAGKSGLAPAFDQSGAATGLLAALAGGLEFAGPVGTIVGSAVGIFQALAGGVTTANTSAQLKKISAQIAALQKDLDAQFAVVDANLNTIFSTLNADFTVLAYQNQGLQTDANSTLKNLLDVEASLNRLLTNTQAVAESVEEQTFYTSLNGCLQYASVHNGQDLNFSQYDTCQNQIYTFAVTTSSDSTLAGVNSDCTTASTYLNFSSLPTAVNVNVLATCVASQLGLAPFASSRLPNPSALLTAIKAYIQLQLESPANAAGVNESRNQAILQKGLVLQTAEQNVNTSGSPFAVNTALPTQMQSNYLAQANGVQTALTNLENQVIADPTLNPGNPDPFGGPDQATKYVPAVFAGATIPTCYGASGGQVALATSVSVPPGIVAQLPRVAVLLEQIHAGSMTACININSWPAGSWVGAAKFAAWQYNLRVSLNGTLVYAKSLYALTYENYLTGTACSVNTLWEVGFHPACQEFLISTQPIGPNCVPLPQLAAKFPIISPQGVPDMDRPAAAWISFVAGHSNWFGCASYEGTTSFPMKNYFAADAFDPEDVAAALAAATTNFNSAMGNVQAGLYTKVAAAANQAGPLVTSFQSLTGTVLEDRALVEFGLPTSCVDFCTAPFTGNAGIADGATVQSWLNGFANTPPVGTHNKLSDVYPQLQAAGAQLHDAIQFALNKVQQNGRPDSQPELTDLLGLLQALIAEQNAGALATCDVSMPVTIAVVPATGGSATLAASGNTSCGSVQAKALDSWLSVSVTPGTLGRNSIQITGAPNFTGSTRSGTVVIAGNAVATITQDPTTAAILTIAETHTGNLSQGQLGAPYVVTVSNGASGAPTTGPVTVTANTPAGLALSAMSGSGWSCGGSTCTRSDILTAGASYSPISVVVNVAANAPSQITNSATVSGGGSASATASDLTTIAPAAALAVSKMHGGNFSQGQSGATYTIVVGNGSPAGPTVGTVTVSEGVPTGLTLVSLTGLGWTCMASTCTRSDVLAGGSSYPAISAVFNVSTNAATQVINSVTVTGGGSPSANTNDPTTINQVQSGNLLSPASGSCAPGAVCHIPLTLTLSGGARVDALTFGATITPGTGAPALTDSLGFVADNAAQAQVTVTTGNTTNNLGVLYQIQTPLTGTVHIGDLLVTLPMSAIQGQTYTADVHGTSAASSGASVPLNPGGDVSLTVSHQYLVGDVSPSTGDSIGSFGDGKLDTLDLLAILRAATGISTTSSCSDAFDAMDSFPADTPAQRGGDGKIDTLDLLASLRRITGIDTARPMRTSRASCSTSQQQTQSRTPGLRDAENQLAFGEPAATTGGLWLTPVYLRAKADLNLIGLAFSAEHSSNDEAQMGLVASAGWTPSLVDDKLPGKIAIAWIRPLEVRNGDIVLLGFIRTATHAPLRFLGVSANAAKDGRAIPIAFVQDR